MLKLDLVNLKNSHVVNSSSLFLEQSFHYWLLAKLSGSVIEAWKEARCCTSIHFFFFFFRQQWRKKKKTLALLDIKNERLREWLKSLILVINPSRSPFPGIKLSAFNLVSPVKNWLYFIIYHHLPGYVVYTVCNPTSNLVDYKSQWCIQVKTSRFNRE